MPLIFLVLPEAHAAELVWDGYYRARGLYLNSLSLSAPLSDTQPDGNALSEGGSFYLDHRLSLRPTWRISEHASLHAQLDVLPFGVYGATAASTTSVTGEAEATANGDGVSTVGPQIEAARAWAEVNTKVGIFRFGRQPMAWGAGLVWNAGLDPFAEYGDSADRLSYTNIFGPVWVMGALDVQAEGYLGAEDDMGVVSLALGYQSETARAGILNSYQYQPSLQWQKYTGSLAGAVTLGPLDVELEAVAQVGGGDTEDGGDDLALSAFGGMLDVAYTREKLGLGLEGGFATGDANPDDSELHAFTFDPDHNVGLFLFEEALPTLAASVPTSANGGRDLTAAVSGDGVSNALYLRPRVSYLVRPDLKLELSWLGALAAKPPEAGRTGYGNEFNLNARFDPFPHVWVQGTGAVFLPGKYYSLYEHEDLGGGFNQTAFGFRLVGTVEF